MKDGFPSLQPLWKRRRTILPIVVGALANGVVYAAVTYRLATKQERLGREQDSLSQSVAARRQELAGLESERDRIGRNDQAADRFWSEVVQPWAPGLTEAVAELHRLASESGLARGRTAYKDEDLENGLVEVIVTMPLQGTYFDLVGFINRVERSPRFFLVRKIGLKRAEDGSERVGLECEVSFFLRSEEGKGTGEP